MSKSFKVIVQTIENNEIVSESVIIKDDLRAPKTNLDFSLELTKQIDIIKGVQDHVLNEKVAILNEEQNACPCCKSTLIKSGNQSSNYHDVFTDHRIIFKRLKCKDCKYEAPCTVRSLFGSIQSGQLQKIQAELGAKHSFREAEEMFDTFSGKHRGINNHDRIKSVSESLGQSLYEIRQEERKLLAVEAAEEIILNVDGGHVKTIEEGRSIEAMASVVYRPENIVYNDKGTRRHLKNKSCAASVKNDNQEEIIAGTIAAALQQGLTRETNITALCDGASNCWNIVNAFEPICKSLTRILDWFHITMKMENISLPEKLKAKFKRVKWHLWRGRSDRALLRLEQLKSITTNSTAIKRITQFITYITNNEDKIVNYSNRKKEGLVFTSNLAESTVETLINQRCKGKQHMRWSRDGLNPILQLRASIHSKGEWDQKWKMAVLDAA